MLKRMMAIVTIVIILLVCNQAKPLQAQNLPYRFALISESPESTKLILIDPRHPDATPQQIAVPLSSFLASVSPDGRWILTSVWTGSQGNKNEAYRLFDTQTGQLRDLRPFDYDSDWCCRDDFLPHWSPDSRAVALLIRTANQFDRVLYSPYSNQYTALPTITEQNTRLSNEGFVRGWSADSKQILVSAGKYHLYPVPGMTPEVVMKDAIQTCQENLSPNAQYVLFVSQCDFASFTYNELYVWDVWANKVKRLTSYTNPEMLGWDSADRPLWVGTYTPLWFDSLTMLTGIEAIRLKGNNAGISPNTVNAFTVAIHLPGGQIDILSDRHISLWAMNPVTQELAYQSEYISLKTPSNDNFSELAVVDQNVHIGNFNGKTLIPSFAYPSAACHLMWSPDGTLLGYSVPTQAAKILTCDTPTQVMFVQDKTHQVSVFNTSDKITAVLGWVQPIDSTIKPYFPEGTSTPIPTISCCG
jgi:hypothetical protein